MSHHYIKFDNVYFRYPSGFEALKGVSFTITHGEKVAVLGANGAGKSTMILHTNGLLMPTLGEVIVGDVKITKRTLPEIRRTVGIVFQNADDQLFMPTVGEDVAFGPRNMGLTEEEVRVRVKGALRAVGYEDLENIPPYQLSGGQKRSVAIATVLAMNPDILVMDEPSTNLDPRARRLLMEQLSQFYHTCIIATHDVDLAARVCSRIIIMSDGRVMADGATENILADAELLARAGL